MLTLICRDSSSCFADVAVIVNSSVDITTLSTPSVFVATEMRAEVYGNRSPGPQSSCAFSFALNKATNTREYSRLCVDSFLTVTIKSERRAWRYTSYSTGSTQLLPTGTWPSHGNSSHPSLTGGWYRLHRHRFGRTRPWIRLCRFHCVPLNVMCT